jgi:hypothetical protein
MVPQAAWGIAGVRVLPDGSLVLDDPALDTRAPLTAAGIDGEPFVGLRAFLGAVAGRRTPIKLQLTGPVTLGIALHGLGVPVRRAFAVAGSAVRARARSLVAAAREVAPTAPLVVFVDEPGLTAAMHPGFPLDPNRTIDLVSSALATIEPHAVTGLHCCGTADWRMVLHTGPQILSLPLDSGAVCHAGALGAFLERGGWVAWGAVPTTGPLGTTPERIWHGLSGEWCTLVYPGIAGALEQLTERGAALSVATSKPQIFADRIVDHFELRKYLPKVYGAELGSERTDKSQLLAHALSSEGLSGTARDKVVMVGDRSHDIRGAKAQGILSVGVLWGYGTLEELGAAKPNRIVIDVDDLADVVSALI